MKPPLTSRDTAILRAFQRQVDRLRRSDVVSPGKVAFRYSTTISFATGKVDSTFEGYNKVGFQAQLPLLRQFLLEQEPISFNRVHGIIFKCCERDDLLVWTKYSRQQWQRALADLPDLRHQCFKGQRLTVAQAVHRLFYGYGGLFHVDIDEPDEEENVREVHEAMLQTAFPRFWVLLNNLDSVIHIWLDEPQHPVPSSPYAETQKKDD